LVPLPVDGATDPAATIRQGEIALVIRMHPLDFTGSAGSFTLLCPLLAAATASRASSALTGAR
jgi:hypothetical protein